MKTEVDRVVSELKTQVDQLELNTSLSSLGQGWTPASNVHNLVTKKDLHDYVFELENNIISKWDINATSKVLKSQDYISSYLDKRIDSNLSVEKLEPKIAAMMQIVMKNNNNKDFFSNSDIITKSQVSNSDVTKL